MNINILEYCDRHFKIWTPFMLFRMSKVCISRAFSFSEYMNFCSKKNITVITWNYGVYDFFFLSVLSMEMIAAFETCVFSLFITSKCIVLWNICTTVYFNKSCVATNRLYLIVESLIFYCIVSLLHTRKITL